MVRLRPAAQRDLDRLPQAVLRRIHKSLGGLANEPRGTQTKKLMTADNLYRLRVGDYRILYEIDDQSRLVLVHGVRHRKDAYRDF
jgi:mRNA interferase RelE/StbE